MLGDVAVVLLDDAVDRDHAETRAPDGRALTGKEKRATVDRRAIAGHKGNGY
ncbi:MAG: hypothetical protein WCS01_08640 [bacterium]